MEGDSGDVSVRLVIRLLLATERDVTVNYSTADGTAKVSDNDYRGKSDRVNFIAGSGSAAFTVLIIGDKKKADRPVETFYVRLKREAGIKFSSAGSSVTVNIANETTDDE